MRLTPIAALVLVAVAGCSSMPKLLVPTGEARVPINNTAALAEFQQQAATDTSEADERAKLRERLVALERQCAELKAYILQQQAYIEASKARGLRPDPKPAMPDEPSTDAQAQPTKAAPIVPRAGRAPVRRIQTVAPGRDKPASVIRVGAVSRLAAPLTTGEYPQAGAHEGLQAFKRVM
jgi:hypothetical protein